MTTTLFSFAPAHDGVEYKTVPLDQLGTQFGWRLLAIVAMVAPESMAPKSTYDNRTGVWVPVEPTPRLEPHAVLTRGESESAEAQRAEVERLRTQLVQLQADVQTMTKQRDACTRDLDQARRDAAHASDDARKVLRSLDEELAKSRELHEELRTLRQRFEKLVNAIGRLQAAEILDLNVKDLT